VEKSRWPSPKPIPAPPTSKGSPSAPSTTARGPPSSGRYGIGYPSESPESPWPIDADGRRLHRWPPQNYGEPLEDLNWINGQESLFSLGDGTLRLFDVVAQKERATLQLPAGERAVRLDLAADRSFATATTTRGAVLLLGLSAPRVKDRP